MGCNRHVIGQKNGAGIWPAQPKIGVSIHWEDEDIYLVYLPLIGKESFGGNVKTNEQTLRYRSNQIGR